MKLNLMKHEELNQHLKNLIRNERLLLHEILTSIAEVDRRRLYLLMGYNSLFEYLTKEMSYSEGSAQRRIDACRLMTEIPETEEKIRNGEISLQQISLIQRLARVKSQNLKLDTTETARIRTQVREMKKEVIELVQSKSKRETEQLASRIFAVPVKIQTKTTYQRDESVRIELTLNAEQFQKLQQAKEILSHIVPTGETAALIDYLCGKVIQQKELPRKPKAAGGKAKVLVDKPEVPTATTAAARRDLFAKQACCQYRDSQSGRRCESRWQLQVDHIQPRWAGGGNEPSNLQILCAKHNRFRYQQQSRTR